MRLREIEFNLKSALTLLKLFNGNSVENVHPPRYNITALNDIKSALSILNQVGLFSKECDIIRLSSISSISGNSIQITVDEYHLISNAINSIKINLHNLLISFEIAIPRVVDSEVVIYIKLPNVQDFDNLNKIIEQLKKAIQLPISLDEIGGQVTITNFDSGSKWFEISVKTIIAASLIGSLAWSGAVIFKKYQEARIVEEHAKQVKLGTEHLEALVEANKNQMNLLIIAEAEHIQNEYFKEHKPEDIERLKLSIKTMSELIDNGAQIQPALLAPEEVSNLFPNYSNLMLIESKQKMIDNK